SPAPYHLGACRAQQGPALEGQAREPAAPAGAAQPGGRARGGHRRGRGADEGTGSRARRRSHLPRCRARASGGGALRGAGRAQDRTLRAVGREVRRGRRAGLSHTSGGAAAQAALRARGLALAIAWARVLLVAAALARAVGLRAAPALASAWGLARRIGSIFIFMRRALRAGCGGVRRPEARAAADSG